MAYNDEALQKGIMSELAAMQYWVSEGYQVLSPYTHESKFDFVVYKDNKFTKVQVKTAILATYRDSECAIWRARNKRGQNGSYELQDYDVLHVCRQTDGKHWVIPHSRIQGIESITLEREDGQPLRSNSNFTDMHTYVVETH